MNTPVLLSQSRCLLSAEYYTTKLRNKKALLCEELEAAGFLIEITVTQQLPGCRQSGQEKFLFLRPAWLSKTNTAPDGAAFQAHMNLVAHEMLQPRCA